ncbi:MAG: metal-sensing transcriptional repressor, partial [Desulfobacterales bacterium]|nr:metal-sensing transcriptional repressor [Desulfobacterales bacterium]
MTTKSTLRQNYHTSHEAIAKRLKRARGHLGKVVSMIEEGAPCVDVARQLQAV